MSARLRFWGLAGAAACLLVAVAAQAGWREQLILWKENRAMEALDFKRLDFTCSREEDHVPPRTATGIALFDQARALHKEALDSDPPDKVKMNRAVQLYREAADQHGDWKATRNVAFLASAGVSKGMDELVLPNQPFAIRYAQKLIDMNVATGYQLMASMADSGWGVKEDQELSLRYMRKAADLGSKDAQRDLGKIFYMTFNKKWDDPVAVNMRAIGYKLAACAARQGDAAAARDMAAFLSSNDEEFPTALFYYQQAGKMGDSRALFSLSKWFKEGRGGYAKDERRAKRYDDYSDLALHKIILLPDLDEELPLPPPPNGGSYPPPEMGWPNAWTDPAVLEQARKKKP